MDQLLDDENIGTTFSEQQLFPIWYRRLLATVLDVILFWLLFYGLLILLPRPKNLQLIAIAFLVLIPIYKIVLEGTIGATLGKKMMGIKVVMDEGNYPSIGLKEANRRFLLAWPMYLFPLTMLGLDHLYNSLTGVGIISKLTMQIQSLLVALAFISAVSCLWNKRKQTWYDRLAKTICIVSKNRPTKN